MLPASDRSCSSQLIQALDESRYQILLQGDESTSFDRNIVRVAPDMACDVHFAGWPVDSNLVYQTCVAEADVCEQHGWSPIVWHQPQYSLVWREIELETLPLCARNEIAVLPWSPLARVMRFAPLPLLKRMI